MLPCDVLCSPRMWSCFICSDSSDSLSSDFSVQMYLIVWGSIRIVLFWTQLSHGYVRNSRTILYENSQWLPWNLQYHYHLLFVLNCCTVIIIWWRNISEACRRHLVVFLLALLIAYVENSILRISVLSKNRQSSETFTYYFQAYKMTCKKSIINLVYI